jgi:sugar phosphate isomerase/epimerase
VRFRHPDGSTVYVGYCTNVHPAEDLDGIIAQLVRYAEPIRARLGLQRLGVGLWLAQPVATALAGDQKAVLRLREELGRSGLEVVTLNAFPYSGFHAASVKKSVYHPDWTDPARLDYTLDCARALASLLPDDSAEGSISTLPLAWREPWTAEMAARAYRQLDQLAYGLERLHAETGRRIRVGLEPEPGCVVEDTEQAIAVLSQVNIDWLGLCLDTCHLAVAHEDPMTALRRLRAAGVPVVKVQASCAVEASQPADPAVRAALGEFAEPRFLHQTKEAARAGHHGAGLHGAGLHGAGLHGAGLHSADDLADALAGGLPGVGPWRVHFHVPLHERLAEPLCSTQDVLLAALTRLLGGQSPVTTHVEVETYTWTRFRGGRAQALGGRADDGLIEGIAAELTWLRESLTALGLTSVEP